MASVVTQLLQEQEPQLVQKAMAMQEAPELGVEQQKASQDNSPGDDSPGDTPQDSEESSKEEGPEGPQTLFSATRPPARKQAAALARAMPPLAGKGLQPPHFHPTTWSAGQIFEESDDPDRTALPWAEPSFMSRSDPAKRAAETTMEELAVRGAAPGYRFARVVRGAMSEADCADLIARVNDKGFTPALLNIGGGRQKLQPYVRDGHRVIIDSPELAAWLLEVLRPHLPERMSDGSRLVGLNERCRFLCYTPGQSFDEHIDGNYRRPPSHPQAGDRSHITVQLYLHDVPEANGGATTFYPGQASAVGHQPETGSVLIFTQDLSHEGSLVKAGLKYTLRTEVMYTFSKPLAA